MSESAPLRQSDEQEPSMEDILASIRRILAEDPVPGEPDASSASEAQTAVAEEESEDDASPVRTIREVVPETKAEGQAALHPSHTRWEKSDDIVEGGPVSPASPPTVLTVENRLRDDRPSGRDEDVFVLRPNMRARNHDLVSDETAADSTDVLSQLARAILDRRDVSVGARNVTLEGMVREMLRPLLHEWLDRNLPYLIERLVKKEINLMINRAERLED